MLRSRESLMAVAIAALVLACLVGLLRGATHRQVRLVERDVELSRDAPTARPADVVTLRGSAITPFGTLPRTRVQVFHASGASEAATDPSGRFKIDLRDPTGPLQVRALHPRWGEAVTQVAPPITQDVTVAFDPRCAVTIAVIWERTLDAGWPFYVSLERSPDDLRIEPQILDLTPAFVRAWKEQRREMTERDPARSYPPGGVEMIRFSIPALPPGIYRAEARSSKLLTTALARLPINGSSAAVFLDYRLGQRIERDCLIEVALSSRGEPLPHSLAECELVTPSGSGVHGYWRADHRGVLVIQSEPSVPGRVLHIDVEGYRSASHTFSGFTCAERLDIDLEPLSRERRVQILSRHGDPIPHVPVWVNRQPPRQPTSLVRRADDEGFVDMDGFSPSSLLGVGPYSFTSLGSVWRELGHDRAEFRLEYYQAGFPVHVPGPDEQAYPVRIDGIDRFLVIHTNLLPLYPDVVGWQLLVRIRDRDGTVSPWIAGSIGHMAPVVLVNHPPESRLEILGIAFGGGPPQGRRRLLARAVSSAHVESGRMDLIFEHPDRTMVFAIRDAHGNPVRDAQVLPIPVGSLDSSRNTLALSGLLREPLKPELTGMYELYLFPSLAEEDLMVRSSAGTVLVLRKELAQDRHLEITLEGVIEDRNQERPAVPTMRYR